jgi:hypothetical protein
MHEAISKTCDDRRDFVEKADTLHLWRSRLVRVTASDFVIAWLSSTSCHGRGSHDRKMAPGLFMVPYLVELQEDFYGILITANTY